MDPFILSKDGSESMPPTEADPTTAPPPPFEACTDSPLLTFQTKFACMSFHMSDCIRFINFADAEVQTLKEATNKHWPKGVRRVRPYGESQELGLHGSPWSRSSDGNDDSRRLVLGLFATLFDMGWVLQASVSITSSSYGKDSMIFRKQYPTPPPCDWIVVSFDRSDKLKMVGGVPQELCDSMVQTFQSKISRHERDADRFKARFHGCPWSPTGKDTVKTRLILVQLLEVLERCGYSVYASLDMSEEKEGETDILVCQRQKGWVSGVPVFHG